jgi:hypothetical protein
MRVRVEIPEPPTRSRSRNVNRAVRTILTVRAMKEALAEAVTAQMQAIAALNGGQRAEAERILREIGVSTTPADPRTGSNARTLSNHR